MPATVHPHPRSAAQAAAARANGARSRGPVTAAGKARSARNALRHGLASDAALVPGEDAEAFADLLAALRAEHAPRTPSEDLLVERLAVTFWKLARTDRLEATLARIEPHCPTGRLFADPGLPPALSRIPELGAVLRHQAQLDRQLHRLLRTLAARPAASDLDPEPAAEPQNGAEPSPRSPGEPEPEAAPTTSAAGAALGPSPRILQNEPEPDLLRRARTDPALAEAIQDQLLANGDLAALARARRSLSAPPGSTALDEPTAPEPA